VAADLGKDPKRITELADSDEMKAELSRLTQRARELGVFGAPSWVVGTELFWGDDRLDDALAWHRTGSLAKA
jgi:2-hydroxychromene-2-carboxylate isomerase